MSRRAAVLSVLLRLFARPLLRLTATPARAAREFELIARLAFLVPPLTCHLRETCAGMTLHHITAGPVANGRVILFLHGGGYLAGSGRTHLGLLARLSRLAGIAVCAPDYRLLQQAPFPAAFDDACAAWEILRARGLAPGQIVLGGDSAGGGLALALLAHLTARGEAPAGLFAFSPWTDLTLSGASIVSNGPRDAVLPVGRMAEVAALYLAGSAAEDGRASPLFARFAAPPPVLLQVGSTEALLDDSRRMAARLAAAGGQADLQIWPGLPHVWQIFDGWLPEARAALRETARFVQASFASASR